MLIDAGSGFRYDHARWYNPQLGTFITQDPTAFAGADSNLYRYVDNSPMNGIDPTGLAELKLSPKDVDSMPWYKYKSKGDEVSNTTVAVGGKYVVQKKRGANEYRVRYTITGDAKIQLDPAAIAKKARTKKGLNMKTAYGHEQRHVENFIDNMERAKAKLDEAEKKVYDSEKEAREDADEILEEARDDVEEQTELDKAHQSVDPESPPDGEPMDPNWHNAKNPTTPPAYPKS